MNSKLKYKILISSLIIIISILHYFTGTKDSPVHNFYRLLYYIPIIFAAFNFGFKGGVITSIIVSLIFSPFMLLSIGSFGWQNVNELFDIILFFAVGIISGTLVEKKNISLLKLDSELKRYVLLENYTSGIIESIKNGVVAINNDMLITMINQGAKDLLGTSEEALGQNITEVFSCCEDIKQRIKESISKGMINESIEIELNKDNKNSILRFNLFPLTMENLNKGLVIIVEDITEITKLQHQLQRNEKLAALGELSTGVAHEVRNPLGIIKAIAQTMRNELKGNEEANKELGIIIEEVERTNKVIKALMEFGKPGRAEKSFCSVNDIVEDVLIIAGKYISQNNVHVTWNKEEVPQFLCNKDQLKQVFINIIFNAVQAMPNGGNLTITAKNQKNGFIGVIYEDTGVGIEEKNLNKIYDPFFTTKDDGTGLGLSIVHRIIEELGGKIYASSKVNIGTKFEILLPK